MLTVEKKNLFYRKSTDGNIELVDAVSGEVLAVQTNLRSDLIEGKMDSFIEVEINGRKLWMEKGLKVKNYAPTVKMNKVLMDLICQFILEGRTLSWIARQPHMPSYTQIKQWENADPTFGAAIELARKTRADALADMVLEKGMEMLEGNLTKNELESARSGIDALKWSAERSNPNKYGPQKQQVDTAVQIIINTGIVRGNHEETIIEGRVRQADNGGQGSEDGKE